MLKVVEIRHSLSNCHSCLSLRVSSGRRSTGVGALTRSTWQVRGLSRASSRQHCRVDWNAHPELTEAGVIG